MTKNCLLDVLTSTKMNETTEQKTLNVSPENSCNASIDLQYSNSRYWQNLIYGGIRESLLACLRTVSSLFNELPIKDR